MTICPRCWRVKLNDVLVRNSLSRKDNKTYICNECGQQEAMNDYLRGLPPDAYSLVEEKK